MERRGFFAACFGAAVALVGGRTRRPSQPIRPRGFDRRQVRELAAEINAAVDDHEDHPA